MSDEVNLLPIVLIVAPLVVLWGLAVFHIVARRPDLPAVGKAVWIAIVLVLPYFGLLLYAGLRPYRPLQATGIRDSVVNVAMRNLAKLVDDHAAGRIDDSAFAHEKAVVFGLDEPTA